MYVQASRLKTAAPFSQIAVLNSRSPTVLATSFWVKGMAEEFRDFHILQNEAESKIRLVRSAKQVFLYIVFSLFGGAAFLEATGSEAHPLYTLAIIIVVFCLYAVLKLDGHADSIKIYNSLLQSCFEDKDHERYARTSGDIQRLMSQKIRKVILPF